MVGNRFSAAVGPDGSAVGAPDASALAGLCPRRTGKPHHPDRSPPHTRSRTLFCDVFNGRRGPPSTIGSDLRSGQRRGRPRTVVVSVPFGRTMHIPCGLRNYSPQRQAGQGAPASVRALPPLHEAPHEPRENAVSPKHLRRAGIARFPDGRQFWLAVRGDDIDSSLAVFPDVERPAPCERPEFASSRIGRCVSIPPP